MSDGDEPYVGTSTPISNFDLKGAFPFAANSGGLAVTFRREAWGSLPLFQYRWNVSQAERLPVCHS
jgi:hypothetical protein